ncbi:hypothetical protein J7E63_11330 [Bacillus sp. ISL-75]|nr:hypothetical protein [Bacillus sp. ISL-75]
MKNLAEGLLVWANVITFFRSGYISDFLNVNPKAVEDLVNLMEYKEKCSDYFKIHHSYVPTPTFGKNSKRVGMGRR